VNYKLEFILVVSSSKNKVIVSSEIVRSGSANGWTRLFFRLRVLPFREMPLNLAPKRGDRVNSKQPMVIDFSLFSIGFISG